MKICKTILAAAVFGSLPWLAAVLSAAAPAAATSLMSPQVEQSPAATRALLAQLAAQRFGRGLDADHNFVISKRYPGADGTQVMHVDHTYKGARVFGSDSVVVSDANGKLISESASELREQLGKGAANRLGAQTADFSVVPSVSEDEAIETAIKALPAGASAAEPPQAELIVYPIVRTERLPGAANKPDDELNALDVHDVVTGYEMVYLVHTRMVALDRPVYHDTCVSAVDGRIMVRWSMLQTVVGGGHSQYNGLVPLNTTMAGDAYQMIDPSRGTGGAFGAIAVTNANHTTSRGELYSNESNVWGDGKQYIAGGSTTDANGETAAVNAMWGLMNTYDMLRNTLGWQSLDGRNTSTYIAAHANTAYDNAYYSDTCNCMFIGDGAFFNSLGAIDVIGHEMGHGVTASTANLLYVGESGGLNESSSDISGEMVEAYARAGGTGALIPNSGNDWAIGTEISKTATPLRFMYKPSKDGNSADAWSLALRFLDVHYSSGPNNRMFYFLSQGSIADKRSELSSKYLVRTPLGMTGIGSDKAYRIWFRSLTTKFTSSTNYADARAKMIQSAQELYGFGSKEEKAVRRAYAAINVGADIDE